MTDQLAYRGRARVADEQGMLALRRLAKGWIRLPLGSLTYGAPVTAVGTKTFVSYSTGGVTIAGTTSAALVAMQPWSDGAGTIYYFQWNPSTSKLLVIDSTGNEVADLTDLSAIIDQPYVATLDVLTDVRSELRLSGAGKILALEVEHGSADDLDASGTDYWTFTGYIRRANAVVAQTIGETLGSFTSETRDFPAQAPMPLAIPFDPVAFGESDRIALVATPTGTPPFLLDVNLWVQIARTVL